MLGKLARGQERHEGKGMAQEMSGYCRDCKYFDDIVDGDKPTEDASGACYWREVTNPDLPMSLSVQSIEVVAFRHWYGCKQWTSNEGK